MIVLTLAILRPYLTSTPFSVHMDHSLLRGVMNNIEQSGRRMRWHLRLAEFEFTVMCKNGTQNTQTDALSRLPTTDETLSQPEGKEIPCFTLITDNVGDTTLETDSDPFWDQSTYLSKTSGLDSLLLSVPAQKPSSDRLGRIKAEELVRQQPDDLFCTGVRARLNGRELYSFQFNDTGCLIRTVEENPLLVIPYSLQTRDLSQYSKTCIQSAERNLYLILTKNFYGPAMAMDCCATVQFCL